MRMIISLITAPAQMRMILIYALAKRDQTSGSGRVSRWSNGGFLAYNIYLSRAG